MAVTKHSPGKWLIRFSLRVAWKPYPIRKREIFAGTKTQALGREADMMRALRVAPSSLTVVADNEIRTLSDAINLYNEKRGPFSKSHGEKVAFVSRELGHARIDQAADLFENWIRILRQKKSQYGRARGAASTNRYIEIVRAAFQVMTDLGKIDKNPISKVRFPKLEEKARDRYLNHEERVRLLSAIREHRPYILPIIQYMLLVPCRKSELTEARRDQYNPFNQTIFIPDSKADIPIYKPVPAEMRGYFDSIPADCPWLFYREDGDGAYHKLGTMQKPWAFCLQKAGLKNVRMHDLRHISATDLYEAGNPERVIMDICGWKTPMLSTYRHKDSLRSAKAIKFLGEPETKECTTNVLQVCSKS